MRFQTEFNVVVYIWVIRLKRIRHNMNSDNLKHVLHRFTSQDNNLIVGENNKI